MKTSNYGSARTIDGRRLRDVQAEQNAEAVAKARQEEEMKKKEEREKRIAEREAKKHDHKLEAIRQEIIENVTSSVEQVCIYLSIPCSLLGTCRCGRVES